MANTYKILGQVAPAATTEVTLYEVPEFKSAVCSSIVICNRGSVATTFRVAIPPGGDATDDKDFLYYDVTLAGNDTFIATIGITLSEFDQVVVYAGNTDLSFNLFGTELS
jgi:hypothetical protein